MGAGANREAAGQNRGPARRALGFDVEVGEACAFGGERVDARCRCASKRATAVTPRLAVAEVVHEHEKNVGLRCRLWLCGRLARFNGMRAAQQMWREGADTRGLEECTSAHHIRHPREDLTPSRSLGRGISRLPGGGYLACLRNSSADSAASPDHSRQSTRRT